MPRGKLLKRLIREGLSYRGFKLEKGLAFSRLRPLVGWSEL